MKPNLATYQATAVSGSDTRRTMWSSCRTVTTAVPVAGTEEYVAVIGILYPEIVNGDGPARNGSVSPLSISVEAGQIRCD